MKKIIYWVAALLCVAFVAVLYQVNVLPIVRTGPIEQKAVRAVDARPGDTVELFRDINVESGDYVAYLVVVDPRRKSPKVQMTSSVEDLRALKRIGLLTVVGGDMATIEDRLIVMKGDSVVFREGISLVHTRGIQCEEYGWLEFLDGEAFNEWTNCLSPVYWPVVSL